VAKYEVIVAGAGHNGLIVAGYLAKAGVSVLVVEAHDYLGGGTASLEVAAPGFKTDVASVGHMLILPNPVLMNDELDLKAKYGLQYFSPEKRVAGIFPDDRAFLLNKSVDKTCECISQFSEKDAVAYRKFYEWGHAQLDMLLAGLYSPTSSFGTLNSYLESSPEGRELMRCMYVSGHDLATEFFEDDHVINMLDRLGSENMMDPRVDGSGMNLLLLVPFMHVYGCDLCIGGSGGLAAALAKSIVDRGGEIRTSAKVKQFKTVGGKCIGVILDDGEEILASRAVVTNFNITQLTPEMLGTSDLPEEYTHNVGVMRMPQFQAYSQGLALHEAPKYKAGPEVDEHAIIEFLPDTVADFNNIWDGFAHGIPNTKIPLCVTATRWDKTRAPEGKHTQYLYQYNPYKLANGASWDDIKDQVGDEILANYSSRCTNMGPENIIGRWRSTPLDFERNNDSWPGGNFNHIGSHISQSFGMRPFPLVSNYRLPVEGLYICGPSTHPGPGVVGAGRAAAVVVLDDLGINFDDVVR